MHIKATQETRLLKQIRIGENMATRKLPNFYSSMTVIKQKHVVSGLQKRKVGPEPPQGLCKKGQPHRA